MEYTMNDFNNLVKAINKRAEDLGLPAGIFADNGKIYLPDGKPVEDLDGDSYGYLLTMLMLEQEYDERLTK